MDEPKPVLHRPPGYRDPAAAPPSSASPVRPPPRLAQIPPMTFQPNPNPPRRPRRRSRCCRLCCCLTMSLLILIILIAAAAAAMYFLFQPHLPHLYLKSLKCPQFAVSSGREGTVVSSDTVIAIQVSNPNSKMEVDYGVTEVRVLVADDGGDVALGSGRVAGFVEETGNSTLLKFNLTAKGVLVDDGTGERLKERYKSKEILFGVDVKTRFGVRTAGVMTGKMAVRWSCGPVSLKKAEGSGAKCGINFLRGLFVL